MGSRRHRRSWGSSVVSNGKLVLTALFFALLFATAVFLATKYGSDKWFDGELFDGERADKVNSLEEIGANEPDTERWNLLYIDLAPSAFDLLQLALGVTTTVVASVFLAISLGRHNRERIEAERAAREEDRRVDRSFSEQFVAATELLAEDNLTKRVAGLHALGNLGRSHLPSSFDYRKDHPRHTQQCIDLMCDFLKTSDGAEKPTPEKPLHVDIDCRRPSPSEEAARQAAVDHLLDIPLSLVHKVPRKFDPERHFSYKINIGDSDLSYVNFQKMSEEGWTSLPPFFSVSLRGSCLYKAKMEGLFLWYGDLSHANIREVDLAEANLHSTRLSKARIRESNLRNVCLNNVDAEKVLIVDTDLRGATLYESNLVGAFLCCVQLKGANFLKAKVQDLEICKESIGGVEGKGENYIFSNGAKVVPCRRLWRRWLPGGRTRNGE